MTDAERSSFTLRVIELARGRAKRLDPQHKTEDRELLDGLFSLLDDLPWDRVRAGLDLSAKTDRFFPDAVNIRKAATEAVEKRTSAAYPTSAALANGECFCPICDNSGWEPTTMDASHVYGPGATVRAVRVCACRGSNPIYRAKRDAERPIATYRRGGEAA